MECIFRQNRTEKEVIQTIEHLGIKNWIHKIVPFIYYSQWISIQRKTDFESKMLRFDSFQLQITEPDRDRLLRGPMLFVQDETGSTVTGPIIIINQT